MTQPFLEIEPRYPVSKIKFLRCVFWGVHVPQEFWTGDAIPEVCSFYCFTKRKPKSFVTGPFIVFGMSPWLLLNFQEVHIFPEWIPGIHTTRKIIYETGPRYLAPKRTKI